MDERQVLTEIGQGEEVDLEFKSAKGGLPRSLWETYSAMANTDGGAILLGLKHKGDSLQVHGLDEPQKMMRDFWNTINNRGKVSLNLLASDDVRMAEVSGRNVLVVRVPRATRKQRPVYVGQNPLDGTYRRDYEGDYKCRPEEVGRMLADQADEPADSRVLEHFGVNDLDRDSIEQYRQRLAARDPDHPWLDLSMDPFLRKLGALRRDRETRVEGLTVGGLLMFGTDEAIRDPAAVPEFSVDYRERDSEDPAIRWTDRVTADGSWVCNLFQFYGRVLSRLTRDLRTPFRLESSLFRSDDTVVHEAVREALTNALVHADYRGEGGVVVEKYRDRFEFSNPGLLLLPVEQIFRGGVSECRNKTLQQMFFLAGYGERAGSGWDKIRQGWKSQNWRSPRIEETTRPDRVQVVLPMVSLVPQQTLEALELRFGDRLRRLNPLQIQALATAAIEHRVSNRRMQQLSDEHPTDLTRMLQGLRSKGLLRQIGQTRGTRYELATPRSGAEAGLPHLVGEFPHNGKSPHNGNLESPRTLADIREGELQKLRQIATPALEKKRLPPDQMRAMILDLCRGRYLTATVLSQIVNRNVGGLRDRFLTPMVRAGLLARKYPEEPNRPDQAYTTQH